jgi:hypothetical protein
MQFKIWLIPEEKEEINIDQEDREDTFPPQESLPSRPLPFGSDVEGWRQGRGQRFYTFAQNENAVGAREIQILRCRWQSHGKLEFS